MAHEKQNSLQSIMKKRQQANLVGRTEEISLFRENLDYNPEDERRKFIFNIFGQGGVGKTTLLRHFLKLAEDRQALTASTDENESDVLGVMAQIAEKIGTQSHSFKSFHERYRTYLQHRQELEADPEVPKNSLDLISQVLTKVGVRLGRQIPVGGAVFDLIDEKALATQVSEWSRFVAQKITNKEEVQLVQHPIETLTPLFLDGLRTIANKHLIMLSFDTYEYTSEYLEKWLLQLLEGYYGDVPANIVIVIAGRNKLNTNLWSGYESFLCNFSLEPFTDQEAREYLSRKNITSERLIEIILQLSGRLPLLVATLASENPTYPSSIEDPSGTAVERFLKWENNLERRHILLNAAFPRHFNLDLIKVLVGEENLNDVFTWLIQKPFVKQSGNNWIYHEIVREQILRFKYHESPQRCSELHRKLAEYYEDLRKNLGLGNGQKSSNMSGQIFIREEFYHRLCEKPYKMSTTTVIYLDKLISPDNDNAEEWSDILEQAAEECFPKENPINAFISAVEEYVSCAKIIQNYMKLFKAAQDLEIGIKKDKIIIDSEQPGAARGKRVNNTYDLIMYFMIAIKDENKIIENSIKEEINTWLKETTLFLNQRKEYLSPKYRLLLSN